MKKIFVKLSMLLFVLVMSTTAWAGEVVYFAQLTGQTSSTGGGKVYVTAEDNDPRESPYEEGVSNVAIAGNFISFQGMEELQVAFWAWPKADNGYCFAGWSYSDNGFDLGKGDEAAGYKYNGRYDVSTQKAEKDDEENITDYHAAEYVIYATFEPIRFKGYVISGDNTTSKPSNVRYCEQTVTITMEGTEIDAADFKAPTISDAKGEGTWVPSSLTINENTVSLTVTFTALDDAVADYSANLVMETQAGVKMNIPLNARTASTEDVEAIRYNKNKAKQGQGALDDMIAAAQNGDIIKLNQDINHQVVINTATKITLDLNGYTITHQLENYTYSPTTSDTDPSRLGEAAILVYNASADVTLAYSPYGGKIIAGPWNDAIVMPLGGKLTLNGGTLVSNYFGIGAVGAEVIENGATIVGGGCAIASMNGTLTIKDGMMYGLVGSMSSTPANTAELVMDGGTIDNRAQTVEGMTIQGGIALQIGSGVATLNRGILIGQTSALNTVGKDLPATVTVEKNVVLKTTGEDTYALQLGGGTTTVNCAKFANPSSLCYFEDNVPESTLIFKSAYFLNETGAVGDEVRGKHLWRNTSGAEFREGYKFFAGDFAAAQAVGVSVCHIGGTSYSKLEEALAYVNNLNSNSPITIVMDNDYTLPAGYYTLPSNVTLLIPMNNDQGAGNKTIERAILHEADTENDPDDEGDYWVMPYKFRKLTLNYGVNLDVFGTIEVSGMQYSTNEAHTGAVYGPYAQLQMNEGSKIVLQNNSELRAWGYITGDIEHMVNDSVISGEIDARRGAMVREQFQIGDWKGAAFSGMGLINGNTVFPINTYFIQNIEVPVKYHPGSKLSTTTSVTATAEEMGQAGFPIGVTMSANDVRIIGVNSEVAMFLMDADADQENTWVRKFYDAKHDKQVYEINSGAYIGSMVIPLVSSPLLNNFMEGRLSENLEMNSGQYNLPITNNFKLHLLSGTMAFTQSTELLPGSEVEIDKESTAMMLPDAPDDDVNGGFLYVYDAQEWGNYAGAAPARRVKYSPVFNGEPTTRGIELDDLKDASINVHGTFNTYGGYVLTSEHGANIFSSTEDAGTFVFYHVGAYDGEPMSVGQVRTATGGSQQDREFTAAQLKNENGNYVPTAGTDEGHSFCFIDMGNGGEWTMLEQRDCFTFDNVSGTYYIKPQEYVAVVVNPDAWDDENGEFKEDVEQGNTDHTFSDAYGAGRLFILTYDSDDNCQWWEVEQKDNYYHCIHPQNDTYYYWDAENTVEDENGDPIPAPCWKEVEFTITWKDWNGSTITTYTVPYGTQAEWLSTNPTRPASVDYTYDFTGWSPELGKVTSDVTYTATFEAKQIKYTITFIQDGGVEIERHLLARDEVPVCENEPTRTGYILQWEPALGPVTGNQTYTATWLPEPPETYTITFKNYDGTVLKKANGTDDAIYTVTAEDTPAYDGATPAKTATSEYKYTFAGWKPALTPATTNATYVAQFNEEAKTYTISYYDEAGSAAIVAQILSYGETPTPPAVTKENPEDGVRYTYVWKTLDGSKTIETVTGDANYKPVFSSEPINYSVSVKSNPSGACTITGVGTYHYNNETTITLTKNEDYTFDGWSDLDNEDPNKQALSRTLTITQDTNLVANFTYDGAGVTIKWKNEAGTEDLVAPVNQKVGTATTYLGEIPTKAATAEFTYTFYGWSTSANGEGTIYKNGMTPKVVASEEPINYYAYFTATRNQYTVTLRNAIAGACEFRGAGVRDYGATVNIVATPNGDYEFVKWQETGSTQADFNLQVTKDVTLTAVVKEKEKPAPANLELGLYAAPVTIEPSTDYTNVIITSDGIEYSSQIIDANNITLYGNADYVLQQAMTAGVWYSVAVPWRVEANGGIYLGNSSAPAELGKDIEIIYYDGAVRAAQGKVDACWVWMKKSSQKVLEPGRAYMFLLRHGAVSKVTFRKKALEPLLTTTTSVSQYASATATDANWNAIANPSLFHAYINAGTTDNRGQRYLPESDTYDWFYLNAHQLVVGEPVYVQAPAAKSIVVANGASYAPARRTSVEAQPTSFDVNITAAGANKYADHISVSLSEDKEENKYIIGQDLVKFGVSTKVAQMWINRYDAKLCVNTIAPEGDVTTFPMSIYAPKAGEYTIAIEREENTNDYALYLTYNGEAIWNLSDGAYTLNLNKGTISNYGLRVSARAPQVTTGVDEAIVEAQGETAMKVLINNQVFIIRGNRVYSVDGQLVK